MFKTTLFISLFSVLISIDGTAQNETVPIPTPAQLAWQDAELTVIYHYDLHVFDSAKYNQTNNRITPTPDYNIFNPKQLESGALV